MEVILYSTVCPMRILCFKFRIKCVCVVRLIFGGSDKNVQIQLIVKNEYCKKKQKGCLSVFISLCSYLLIFKGNENHVVGTGNN